MYEIDDGTAEGAYAFGNGVADSGSIWLNEFTVTSGFNKIASVSIAWGEPGAVNEDVSGLPMQALIYNDPNGDGSPLDGSLLASATGTVQSVGTNTFITYTFSSPVLLTTSNFFVGYFVPGFSPTEGAEQYFAALNESAGNIPARSFVFGNADGSTPSLTNLSSDTVGGSNATLGIAGNWLVRANAVPEPSTWALLLGGGIGAGVLLARRRAAGQTT